MNRFLASLFIVFSLVSAWPAPCAAQAEEAPVPQESFQPHDPLEKQQNLIFLAREASGRLTQLPQLLEKILIEQSGLAGVETETRLLGWILGLMGLLGGVWLRVRLQGRTPKTFPEGRAARLGGAFRVALGRQLPFLGLTVFLFLYFLAIHLPIRPAPYPASLMLAFLGYLAALIAIRTCLDPIHLDHYVLSLEPAVARTLARWLRLTVFLGLVLLLVAGPWLPDGLPEPLYYLLRFAAAVLFGLASLRLVRLLGRMASLAAAARGLRNLLVLFYLALLAMDLFGYRNLSGQLFRAVVGTAAIGLLLWYCRQTADRILDDLASGRTAWQRRIRQNLGIKGGESFVSVISLRLLIDLLLLVAFLLAALRLGTTRTHTLIVISWLTEGFSIGPARISPLRLFNGLLLFSLLWTATLWIRNRLKQHWLATSPLSMSAKDTLETMTVYLGFSIAVLTGLSMAGVDFTKLALIAGALSVGIGFGLQNIVNNFISGIILLFERPIRRDDWIVVGQTEGYVKKVSVRSTTIQTFDRAEVIVPNSELLSSQVTNWMLTDRRGRVIVPVGVAYGSDTAEVKRLLLEAAAAHPLVVKDGSVPEPYVLFREFGESSLNFELRCFINEIEYRLSTRSDLNFAIDAAFREHGITIPFPQRDLWVKEMPRHASHDQAEKQDM